MPKRKRLINSILGGQFIREHMVPTAGLFPLVIKALKKERDPHVSVSLLISECCHVVYVTSAEDTKLTRAGLGQGMPEDWEFDQNHTPSARYKEVGICLADAWPEDCLPNLRGRPAEMGYAKVEWSAEQAAAEIIKLWNANLCKPCIPIRAILVGFPHSKNMRRMSVACKKRWKEARI